MIMYLPMIEPLATIEDSRWAFSQIENGRHGLERNLDFIVNEK